MKLKRISKHFKKLITFFLKSLNATIPYSSGGQIFLLVGQFLNKYTAPRASTIIIWVRILNKKNSIWDGFLQNVHNKILIQWPQKTFGGPQFDDVNCIGLRLVNNGSQFHLHFTCTVYVICKSWARMLFVIPSIVNLKLDSNFLF